MTRPPWTPMEWRLIEEAARQVLRHRAEVAAATDPGVRQNRQNALNKAMLWVRRHAVMAGA